MTVGILTFVLVFVHLSVCRVCLYAFLGVNIYDYLFMMFYISHTAVIH